MPQSLSNTANIDKHAGGFIWAESLAVEGYSRASLPTRLQRNFPMPLQLFVMRCFVSLEVGSCSLHVQTVLLGICLPVYRHGHAIVLHALSVFI
eukprot:scaffold652227_cov45-Prasinocladus_malaysianus.AAC.1